MQKTTDASPGRADPAVQHSRALKTVLKLLPPLAGLILMALILAERSAYYAELRSAGFRMPYSDVLLLAGGVLFAVMAGLFTWLPGFSQAVYRLRARLGWTRWLVVFALAVAVSWLFVYSDYSLRFDGFFTRLYIYLAAGLLVLLTASDNSKHPFEWVSSITGLLVCGAIFMLMNAGRDIVDYPFRLSWSEGNRFYDYSVLFGRRLYDFPADKGFGVFIDKGRQFLWGLPFLFGDISIRLMRFWNEFLFTIPYFLLGFVFLRRRDTAPAVPFLFGLWVMLFLNNGPIYTPLILVCILVVLTRRSPLWLAAPVVFAAGYFAHASRFTWMFAPAMWAVLLAFLDPRQKAKPRWIRSIVLGVSGLLGGYIFYNNLAALLRYGTLTPAVTAFTLTSTSDVVSSQTLLWDRLFPTGTFALGVLPALILLTLPALILIIHAIATRRWKLDGWQKLYLAAISAAFLVVGVIISVKIGGGSNLHNLDMFLITVALAAGLMLETRGKDGLIHPGTLRRWQQIILLIAVLYPATFNMFSVQKLVLPDQAVVKNGLEAAQNMVREYQKKGEVLFMDQRQLLTFGYIQNVPLVSEYEKKLVMENAITDNHQYFERFYQDLASQRFSLIITEPLYTGLQEEKDQFAHENNAWVRYVSVPMLCYYRAEETYTELGLQILVPRDNFPRRVSDTIPCPGE